MSNWTFDSWRLDAFAGLSREVDVPGLPYAYGSDLSCALDLEQDYSEVDPASPTAVGQAIIRSWITPRGALLSIDSDGEITSSDYGAGLLTMLNRGATLQEYSEIKQRLELEARKDDRVDQIVVTVTGDPIAQAATRVSATATRVSATATLRDSNQSFELVLAVDGTGAIVDAVVKS